LCGWLHDHIGMQYLRPRLGLDVLRPRILLRLLLLLDLCGIQGTQPLTQGAKFFGLLLDGAAGLGEIGDQGGHDTRDERGAATGHCEVDSVQGIYPLLTSDHRIVQGGHLSSPFALPVQEVGAADHDLRVAHPVNVVHEQRRGRSAVDSPPSCLDRARRQQSRLFEGEVGVLNGPLLTVPTPVHAGSLPCPAMHQARRQYAGGPGAWRRTLTFK